MSDNAALGVSPDNLAALMRAIESREVKEILGEAAAIDPDVLTKVLAKIIEKDMMQRFKVFFDVLNRSIAENPSLVTGPTLEERYRQYIRLVGEVEALWDDAVLLFDNGRYARATSLAISCIEEVGKIDVARFQMSLSDDARARLKEKFTKQRSRGNPLYSHTKKHLLAAGAGAIVNARLDRILGDHAIVQFLDAVETNEISRIREAALHVDCTTEKVLLPSEAVSPDQARFYVALAGELLAEVLGFAPDQWERLLAKVKRFERYAGLDAK